jgi:hypothetical protein
MKALLEMVKARLLSQVEGLSSQIVNDDFFIPEEVKLPFAGVKNAGFQQIDLAGGMKEQTLRVKVIIFVEHHGNEEALALATLEAQWSIKAVLDGWTPDGYIIGGDLVDFSDSKLVHNEKGEAYIQPASLTFEYVREVEA